MGRVTYKGFDLPDGNAIPDVPADLTKLVDGVMSPSIGSQRIMMREVAGAAANGAAGSYMLMLTIPFVENRGGVLVTEAAVRLVPWGVSQTAGSGGIRYTLDWSGSTQRTRDGQAAGFATQPAPGSLVTAWAYVHDAQLIPANVGNITMRLYGRHDFAAGWVGGNVEFNTLKVLLTFYPLATVETPL